ncbi:unnamed protein product [Owenia fusiformis]|uniref:Protein kintoun n=1 Tax=Owenia fusiformis TaxID=6347 RepID=A0A8J1U6H9_OWEFU|nr:unnamed protein product [Owenia fusiformis]
MASQEFKNLDVTKEEIDRITKSLKDEEFRKLFVEYAEELSDPETRRKYEAEIAQMESERGMDVQFVHPQPGYVIKTTVDGEKKAFINMSMNDLIDKPRAEKSATADGKRGLQWRIPHSFAPPREDVDKGGAKCTVYDCVFHHDTMRMAESNNAFKNMIETTALEGIEKQFDVSLDRKNVRHPKMKFKGVPTATVIRTKKSDASENKENVADNGIMKDFPYPYDNKTTAEKSKEAEDNIKQKEKAKLEKESKVKRAAKKADTTATEPKYTITHRSHLDFQDFRDAPDAGTSTRPNELVITIQLPLLKSAAPVELDIFEKQLKLESKEPAAYKLDLPLSYPVDENNGSAKFDKSKRHLVVTLPVLPEETSTVLSDIQNGITDPTVPNTSNTNNDDDHQPENPLIQVLSTEDAKQEMNAGDDLEIKGKPNDTQTSDDNQEAADGKDIWSMQDINPNHKPKVTYSLPKYSFHQDAEAITIVLNTKNISEDSISKAFPAASNGCRLQYVSIGSGCFPVHYSLSVQFPADCTIVPESTTIDVSDQNAVLILYKTNNGIWDKCLIGINEESLEEKLFPTVNNVQTSLDNLEADHPKEGDTIEVTNNANLEVTEMSQDKLTIEIKSNSNNNKSNLEQEFKVPLTPTKKKQRKFSESGDEIEVVHDKQSPRLHSILKNRTCSESSDDIGYGKYSRESSLGDGFESQSTISESEGTDGPDTPTKIKKSLSFNDHVDSLAFKTNASVSSMKTTLKSKRRRQKKKEQRQANPRRRRTSSNDYSSSEDQTSPRDVTDNTDSVVVNGKNDKHKQLNGDNDEDFLEVDETKENENDKGVEIEVKVNDEVKPKPIITDSKDGGTKKSKSNKKVQIVSEKADSDDDAENDGDVSTGKSLWKETNGQNNGLNEHKTKCAFEFTNSVIYDLDED